MGQAGSSELARAAVLAVLAEHALAANEAGGLFREVCHRASHVLWGARLGVFELTGPDRGLLRLCDGEGFTPTCALELPASLIGEAREVPPRDAGLREVPPIGALEGQVGLAAPIYVHRLLFGAVLALFPTGRDLDRDERAFLSALARLLGAAIARLRTEEALRASEARMELAQELAQLGSYDWDIATDTNTWSPELFRIYGYEPGAFNPSYEKFISLVHPDDRERIRAVHQQAYRDCKPYAMEERIVRPDGEVRTLQSNGVVITDASGRPVRMAGICLDVTERKRTEELARQAGETELRRKGAFEINDTIVQGLCTIIYSLELGRGDEAKENAGRTLDAARGMMNELMGPATPRPGDLRRVVPSSPERPPSVAAAPVEDRAIRVVVADDSEDLRGCIQGMLDLCDDLRVVGEARNGVEAIEVCERLRPDVVLLDLSMPVMDGLEALPLIRERSPDTSVLVLSGFESRRMQQPAMGLGAAGYLQKGGDPNAIVEEIRAVCRRSPP